MHGDLISRKRVIETIWDVFNSYANDSQRFDEYETEAINNAFTVLQKCVENQQTAYSVEDVVEEIREYYDNVAELGGHFLPQVVTEIVRNGGKE
jgi:acetyl-CoA carboxylase carboxyltransferase component